ncbi:MAG: OmpH family outer membrane protein [Rickettsiaceae bacterium H1]|nr:OmpH family outer membrane protein [Rickettsiaceae bacterium H1]
MLKILVFLLLCFSTVLSADDIAIVDMQLIMQNSTAVKNLNNQLEHKKSKLKKEVAEKEELLKNVSEELSKQSKILSEEALKKKENEFQEQVVSAQKDIQAKSGVIEESYVATLEEINKKITDLITGKSKSLKIDLVIPKSHVLFFGNKIKDLSDEIIRDLNKKLVKIDMNDYAS